MNRKKIIEKYTRSKGSWGITKDFIIIDDIPQMLDELRSLEQQQEVSESNLRDVVCSKYPSKESDSAGEMLDIIQLRKAYIAGYQSSHPQPISEGRIEELWTKYRVSSFKESKMGIITYNEFKAALKDIVAQEEDRADTIEKCKQALLKQLHPMVYKINGYPIEAVPKADILALGALVSIPPEQ